MYILIYNHIVCQVDKIRPEDRQDVRDETLQIIDTQQEKILCLDGETWRPIPKFKREG